MDLTARLPLQRPTLVDSLDLWCVLCMLKYEAGAGVPGPEDLARIEEGGWMPSARERHGLAAQPSDLGWVELALGLLHDALAAQHPGWEGEALLHLASVLARREVRLRVAMRTEWAHDTRQSILAAAGEGFPNIESIQWRPQKVRS